MDVALEDLASDLADDSAGTAQFVARAVSDIDGRYAVVGWGAAEDYEEHNKIQVFSATVEWWMTILETVDEHPCGICITITDPVIAIDEGAITWSQPVPTLLVRGCVPSLSCFETR